MSADHGSTAEPGAGEATSSGASSAASSGAGRRGTAGVGIASIVSAGAGALVLIITAKALSEADNADFLTFWSLLFFLFGTLGGLQSETTRAVHESVTAADVVEAGTHRAGGARAVVLATVTGLALAAVTAASGPLWAPTVLSPAPLALTCLVVVGVLAFAGHSGTAGSLAGSGRWTTFSGLVGAEATVRLLLICVAALLGAGVVGLAAASAVAAGTWLVAAAVVPGVRTALGRRTGAPLARMARPTALAMLGAASNAALVVGFMVLLRATTGDAEFKEAAPLMLAIQLTRAPLLIPLGAYQGMAITYVLRNRDRGLAPLVRIAGAVAAFGVVAAGLAAAVGPWLLATVIKESYRVDALLLFELTLAAAVLALLTLTGAAAIAVRAHGAFSLGWVAATVVAAALLLLPGSVETRAVLSLAIGPLVGVVVHATAVRRAFAARR